MSTAPRIEIKGQEDVQQLIRNAPEDVQDLLERGLQVVDHIPDEYVGPDQDKKTWGHEMIGAYAWDEKLFDIWWQEENHNLREGELDAQLKELISILVAKKNDCVLCVPFHAGAALYEGAERDIVDRVYRWEDKKDGLPEKLQTTLSFVLKAVFEPREVRDEDVEALKELGYSDRQIVELVAAGFTAYRTSAFNQIFNLTS